MKRILTLIALFTCLATINAQNYITINDTSFASWLNINIPNAMSGNQMDTTHSDVIFRRQVIIQNKHIANLDGIQYFKSLKKLDCSVTIYDSLNLRLSYLPLLPNSLDTLICDGNKIDSLPILPSNLLYLSCNNNSLDSLMALPNTIKKIYCLNNQIEYIQNLPDSLQILYCNENNLNSLPNLPAGLKVLYCSANYLQSLPALSDSLETLYCQKNQLQTLPTLPGKISFIDCGVNSISVLPSLPNSLITLYCNNNNISSLPTLSNSLVDLDCSANQLSTLPALPNSLNIINCATNYISSLPALPNALTKLITSNNPSIGNLPALPNSLEILHCESNSLQSLPVLPISLQDLNCSSNAISNLPALPQALVNLECRSNQLATLPTLPNSLVNLDCSINQLTTLVQLPNNLSRLNCGFNTINNLPSLSSLAELFCNNNVLTTLPLLPQSLISLDCSNNLIQCFDPFVNNFSIIFNIRNNPFTCLPNYIPLMDSTTLLYPLCAAGNPFNCPSSYGIVGFTYQDNNMTCLKDSGDLGLKNVPMKILDNTSAQIGKTYTALNGVYQFLNTGNTYNIIVDTAGMPFDASCIYPGLDSTVIATALDTNINFSLKCKPGVDIGIQSVHRSCIVFPGQTHYLSLNAGDMSKRYNLNCAAGVGGILRFNITGPVNYMGPAPGALTPTVVGNYFSYAIADFATINNETDFKIMLQPFTSAQAGDLICINAKIDPSTADINSSNNEVTACYAVQNSHDPNIKEVYPVNVEFGYRDWFTYTIHFQNTGNAPAFNIMLKDTMDSELDLNTFQVTDYSHVNNTTLNGNVLTVYFPNIQLPDSATDAEGSIGFIQYRLKAKTTWKPPHKIKNTAYIYFDFNAPIVTNTTYNSYIDMPTSVSEKQKDSYAIYPNPTNGIFTIEFSSKEKQNIQILDIAGNIVLLQTIENGKGNIDANHLAAGIYNVNIKGNSGITNKKLVIVK